MLDKETREWALKTGMIKPRKYMYFVQIPYCRFYIHDTLEKAKKYVQDHVLGMDISDKWEVCMTITDLDEKKVMGTLSFDLPVEWKCNIGKCGWKDDVVLKIVAMEVTDDYMIDMKFNTNQGASK